MATQIDRLNHYLHSGKTINPLSAWLELGIYRLSARVFDLRDRGVNIKTRMVSVKNRWGEEVVVAEYYINKPNESEHDHN